MDKNVNGSLKEKEDATKALNNYCDSFSTYQAKLILMQQRDIEMHLIYLYGLYKCCVAQKFSVKLGDILSAKVWEKQIFPETNIQHECITGQCGYFNFAPGEWVFNPYTGKPFKCSGTVYMCNSTSRLHICSGEEKCEYTTLVNSNTRTQTASQYICRMTAIYKGAILSGVPSYDPNRLVSKNAIVASQHTEYQEALARSSDIYHGSLLSYTSRLNIVDLLEHVEEHKSKYVDKLNETPFPDISISLEDFIRIHLVFKFYDIQQITKIQSLEAIVQQITSFYCNLLTIRDDIEHEIKSTAIQTNSKTPTQKKIPIKTRAPRARKKRHGKIRDLQSIITSRETVREREEHNDLPDTRASKKSEKMQQGKELYKSITSYRSRKALYDSQCDKIMKLAASKLKTLKRRERKKGCDRPVTYIDFVNIISGVCKSKNFNDDLIKHNENFTDDTVGEIYRVWDLQSEILENYYHENSKEQPSPPMSFQKFIIAAMYKPTKGPFIISCSLTEKEFKKYIKPNVSSKLEIGDITGIDLTKLNVTMLYQTTCLQRNLIPEADVAYLPSLGIKTPFNNSMIFQSNKDISNQYKKIIQILKKDLLRLLKTANTESELTQCFQNYLDQVISLKIIL